MNAWTPSSWDPPSDKDGEVSGLASSSEFCEALWKWASAHPQADLPIVDIATEEAETAVSPRRLASALKDWDDPLHEVVVRLFDVGLSGYRGDAEDLLNDILPILTEETELFHAHNG